MTSNATSTTASAFARYGTVPASAAKKTAAAVGSWSTLRKAVIGGIAIIVIAGTITGVSVQTANAAATARVAAAAKAASVSYSTAKSTFVSTAKAENTAATNYATNLSSAKSYDAAIKALTTASRGYISSASITKLTAAEKNFAGSIGAPTPKTVTAAIGTTPKSTIKLNSAAKALHAQTKAITANSTSFATLSNRLTSGRTRIEAALKTYAAEVPADAKKLHKDNPHAAAVTVNTVTVATRAVTSVAKRGGELRPPLRTYVKVAAAEEASNAAAVAATQAAAVTQQSAFDHATGTSSGYSSGTTYYPNGNYSGGSTTTAPSPGGGTTSGGGTTTGSPTSGGAPSGGGSSSGGGTTTPPVSQPAPVDHTTHVVANGQYTPGCDGVQMYTQSTSSGGTIIINVGYAYTYSTYSTSDGWGLTVYGCA